MRLFLTAIFLMCSQISWSQTVGHPNLSAGNGYKGPLVFSGDQVIYATAVNTQAPQDNFQMKLSKFPGFPATGDPYTVVVGGNDFPDFREIVIDDGSGPYYLWINFWGFNTEEICTLGNSNLLIYKSGNISNESVLVLSTLRQQITEDMIIDACQS